jgi:hypothetical protein
MKRNVITFVVSLIGAVLLSACTKEKLTEFITQQLSGDDDADIVAGLREALRVGTDTSVSILNKENGYFQDLAVKILMPEEVQNLYNQLPEGLAKEGLTPVVNDLILKVNRAAEDAAVEAKPIFVNAITNISIVDGYSILKGNDNAATMYLKGATYEGLRGLFQPKIEASLAKEIVGGVSASSTYTSFVNTYNDAVDVLNLNPFKEKEYQKITTNSLSEHTTRKALDGLFLKVAEEEKAIRTNPLARVTEILKKVFGS